MAEGDVTFFNQFLEDESDKIHNLSGDSWKLGLITSTVTPTPASSDPRWGAGGGTNFSTNEVTPGGNYAAGGVSLSAVITDNIVRAAGQVDFIGDNVSIAQHASNPANARWGIIYNDTDAGKRAVAFVDLGAVTDLTQGPFTITWSGANIIASKTAA